MPHEEPPVEVLDLEPVKRPSIAIAVVSLLTLLMVLTFNSRLAAVARGHAIDLRARINAADKGISTVAASSVAEEFELPDHPGAGLYARSRNLITGSRRSRTWERVLAELGSSKPAALDQFPKQVNFVDAMSLLRVWGSGEEDYALLSRAAKYKGEHTFMDWELEIWLRLGFAEPARLHFERGEYFLGMDAVRDGLKRARVRPLNNLKGATDLAALVSPLVIVDAFFPVDPKDASEEAGELSQRAAQVLHGEYEKLANGDVTPLTQYAAGVRDFRAEDYDSALKHFSEARSIASRQDGRDLASFMLVRVNYWNARARLEKYDLQAGETPADRMARSVEALKIAAPNATDRPELPASESGQSPAEAQVDRLATIFARAIVREMKAAGVLRAQAKVEPAAAALKPRPSGPTAAAVKNARAEFNELCRSARADLQAEVSKIASSYWRQQASEYITGLDLDCEPVRQR